MGHLRKKEKKGCKKIYSFHKEGEAK